MTFFVFLFSVLLFEFYLLRILLSPQSNRYATQDSKSVGRDPQNGSRKPLHQRPKEPPYDSVFQLVFGKRSGVRLIRKGFPPPSLGIPYKATSSSTRLKNTCSESKKKKTTTTSVTIMTSSPPNHPSPDVV